MLLTEIPVYVAAARLGDDPAAALRVYSHQLPSTQQQAAAKFEAPLRLAGGEKADSVSGPAEGTAPPIHGADGDT